MSATLYMSESLDKLAVLLACLIGSLWQGSRKAACYLLQPGVMLAGPSSAFVTICQFVCEFGHVSVPQCKSTAVCIHMSVWGCEQT